jgi:hypothetical protein
MSQVRINGSLWLTRAGPNTGLGLQRGALKQRAGLAARTLATALLAAGLCTGVAASGSWDTARASAQAPADPPDQGKRQGRLAAWSPAEASAKPAAAQAPGPTEPDTWREAEFPKVTVLDGRTLSHEGLVVRLEGLALPAGEQVCRTLDGRLESCLTRAATQLELLTRGRTVTCRYRMTTSSEAAGACRVGSSDLAQRLLRTSYVQRETESGDKTALAALAQN